MKMLEFSSSYYLPACPFKFYHMYIFAYDRLNPNLTKAPLPNFIKSSEMVLELLRIYGWTLKKADV